MADLQFKLHRLTLRAIVLLAGLALAAGLVSAPVTAYAFVDGPYCDPGDAGTATIAQDGDMVTLTATSNEGYSFAGWVLDAADASRSFQSSENPLVFTDDYFDGVTVTATFAAGDSADSAGGLTVKVSASPEEGGSVTVAKSDDSDDADASGDAVNPEGDDAAGDEASSDDEKAKKAEFAPGSTVKVTAVAKSGYAFVNWTEDGEEVSKDATYSFTIEKDRNLVANFAADEAALVDGDSLDEGADGDAADPDATDPDAEADGSADPDADPDAATDPEANPDGEADGSTDSGADDPAVPVAYTITFVNDDGTELQSGEVAAGEMPAYEGDEPAKEPTDEFTYAFAGWDPEVIAAEADATYTATFTETPVAPSAYNVTVTVNDEAMGEAAASPTSGEEGTEVTLTATPAEGYQLEEWQVVSGDATIEDNTFTLGAQDVEILAVFGEVPAETYTITFVNDDGTELQSGEVAAGEMPAYEGEEPTKEPTDEYTYEFKGWDPEIVAAEADATYTATYEETPVEPSTYDVDVSVNDDTMGEATASPASGEEGTEVTLTATPAEGYQLEEWQVVSGNVTIEDNELTIGSEDVAVLAVFGEEPAETYTVSASASPAEGGTVEGAGTYEEGASATVSAKANEGYEFVAWKEGASKVSSDAKYEFTVSADRTLTAEFKEKAPEAYTIKFVNDDGTELQSSEVVAGEMPAYKGAEPTKTATGYTYKFKGWDPQIVAAEADATYTATYEETANTYEIKFVDEDGTLLQSGKVAYGAMPAYSGATPTKEGDEQNTYTFAGWSPKVATVTGDATYTATYDKAVRTYLVKFLDDDGTVLQSSELAYGTTPTYSGATPAKKDSDQYTYAFAGWSPAVTTVTRDITYIATYSKTAKTGTLTFDLEGGTLDGKTGHITITANVGEVVTIPNAPEREGYTFKYWQGSEYHPGDSYTVEGDHVFTAVWEKAPANGKGSGASNVARTGDNTPFGMIVLFVVALGALGAIAWYASRQFGKGKGSDNQ